jgi:transposase
VGASPLFPPQHKTAEEAREELQHLVNRAPDQFNQSGTRWKLETVRAACAWLNPLTISGVWQVLDRLGIGLKRGRDHLHSPDPHYVWKLADIVATLRKAANSNGRVVVVFADEFSFYRQPTLARDYCAVGSRRQPLARRSYQPDHVWRIVGGLNALSGKMTSTMTSKVSLSQMVKFLEALRTAYPRAKVIYLVVDNWPIHYHPDVLAALEPQKTRWELKVPDSWPTKPSRKAKRLNLPIQLLPLPTYASWCNPIEKLWRWLKQELLHLHPYADDWQGLKQKVKEFLGQFQRGSKELLRYVGLTPNSKLYGAVLAAIKGGLKRRSI